MKGTIVRELLLALVVTSHPLLCGAQKVSGAPNATPVSVTLIDSGSMWRFLDNAAPPPTDWAAPGFVDSGWGFGAAQFGTGEGDEATRIPPVTGRPITYYFRHRFSVSDAQAFTNLLFGVLRDDGVVVYVNGQEAFRMNMPPGLVDHSTLASSSVMLAEENVYFPTNLPASLLVNGTNVIAVELHQDSDFGIDASFDLRLTAFGPAPVERPSIAIERPDGKVLLRWESPDCVLEERILPAGGWIPLPNAASPYEIPNPEGSRLYRLWKP